MGMVVLCGGSGFAPMCRRFAAVDPDLRLIINGFDDGMTTGSIRERLAILGPSDFGKVVGTLLPSPLARWWEDRRFVFGGAGSTDELLRAGRAHGLDHQTAARIDRLIRPYESCCAARPVAGVPPRNFVTAALLARHRDHANRAVGELADLFALPRIVVSVTDHDAQLTARTTSGRLIDREHQINTTSERLDQMWVTTGGQPARISDDARRVLFAASSIVLGPGSSYSSVIASMVVVAPFIRAARTPCIWVQPLAPESPGAPQTDTQAVEAVARLTGAAVISDTLSHQNTVEEPSPGGLMTRQLRGWRRHHAQLAGSDGRHDPDRLLAAISAILARRDFGQPRRATAAGTHGVSPCG